MSSQGSVTAGLAPRDGPRGGGAGAGPSASVGPGSLAVKKSEGSQRPNYGVDDINAADRRHTSDPAIRQASDWI